MPSQEQIVLKSYRAGSRTNYEVSIHTGLSIKHCAAYTSVLEDKGLLRRSGRAVRRGLRGQPPYFFVPQAVAK